VSFDPIVVDPIVVDPIVVDPIVVDPIVVDPISILAIGSRLSLRSPQTQCLGILLGATLRYSISSAIVVMHSKDLAMQRKWPFVCMGRNAIV
jgi:hypothetical protein